MKGGYDGSASASAVTEASVEFWTVSGVDCSIDPSVSWGLKVLGNEERVCKTGKTA